MLYENIEKEGECKNVTKVCFLKARIHRHRAGATIVDLAKVSGVGRDTIRFQENKGLITPPKAYQIFNGLNTLLAGATLDIISPKEFEEHLVYQYV